MISASNPQSSTRSITRPMVLVSLYTGITTEIFDRSAINPPSPLRARAQPSPQLARDFGRVQFALVASALRGAAPRAGAGRASRPNNRTTLASDRYL